MIAVTRSAGVTSNAGCRTGTPSGTILLPAMCVISAALRSSIGMPAPLAVFRSMVDVGAAT